MPAFCCQSSADGLPVTNVRRSASPSWRQYRGFGKNEFDANPPPKAFLRQKKPLCDRRGRERSLPRQRPCLKGLGSHQIGQFLEALFVQNVELFLGIGADDALILELAQSLVQGHAVNPAQGREFLLVQGRRYHLPVEGA